MVIYISVEELAICCSNEKDLLPFCLHTGTRRSLVRNPKETVNCKYLCKLHALFPFISCLSLLLNEISLDISVTVIFNLHIISLQLFVG